MQKIRTFFGTMTGKMLGIAMVAMLALPSMASATAQYDLSPVSTGFTDQVLNAVTTALPIAGPIIALFVGWKVLRRLVRG
jgi:hypothetical protein